jgi:hypothetical protein
MRRCETGGQEAGKHLSVTRAGAAALLAMLLSRSSSEPSDRATAVITGNQVISARQTQQGHQFDYQHGVCCKLSTIARIEAVQLQPPIHRT